MGAVFALFAGFYFWSGKIFGFVSNEKLAAVHFWIFTIAVNIVFMPMHNLGIAGLPRRYPDYPQAYESWNHFISYGSILTVISVALFLYIVAHSLLTGRVNYLAPVRYGKFA